MGFREWMFFSLVWDSLGFRMEESKTQVSFYFLIGAFGSRSLLHPGKLLDILVDYENSGGWWAFECIEKNLKIREDENIFIS